MDSVRVYISFHPKLYADIFTSLLGSLQSVGIIEHNFTETSTDTVLESEIRDNQQIDVVLTSLDAEGRPAIESWSSFPEAKILALASNSDYGYRRLPGANNWEVIRPFRLSHLFFEILSNSELEPSRELIPEAAAPLSWQVAGDENG